MSLGGAAAAVTLSALLAACGQPPVSTGNAPAAPATATSTAGATDNSGPPPSVAPPALAPPSAPSGVALPNPRLTPGETFASATVDQICTSGYASRVRHVDRQQYVDVYASYGLGYPQTPGAYELDHLIPLELGGDNTDSNLWPEPSSPTPGFHEKDHLENVLHGDVCGGRIDLATAQHAIAANWYQAYVTYAGG